MLMYKLSEKISILPIPVNLFILWFSVCHHKRIILILTESLPAFFKILNKKRDDYLKKIFDFVRHFEEEQNGEALKASINKILNK